MSVALEASLLPPGLVSILILLVFSSRAFPTQLALQALKCGDFSQDSLWEPLQERGHESLTHFLVSLLWEMVPKLYDL